MEHNDVMERLLDEVDVATDKLLELNPTHPHLQYDFTDKSNEEKERLTTLFYINFGPKDPELYPSADQIKELTWSNFLTQVKAAIFVELVKVGFRRPT